MEQKAQSPFILFPEKICLVPDDSTLLGRNGLTRLLWSGRNPAYYVTDLNGNDQREIERSAIVPKSMVYSLDGNFVYRDNPGKSCSKDYRCDYKRINEKGAWWYVRLNIQDYHIIYDSTHIYLFYFSGEKLILKNVIKIENTISLVVDPLSQSYLYLIDKDLKISLLSVRGDKLCLCDTPFGISKDGGYFDNGEGGIYSFYIGGLERLFFKFTRTYRSLKKEYPLIEYDITKLSNYRMQVELFDQELFGQSK